MAFGIIVKGVKVTLKEVKLQRCLTVQSTRKNQNNYFKKEGCYEIDRMGSN
jgi:hypothetical protein